MKKSSKASGQAAKLKKLSKPGVGKIGGVRTPYGARIVGGGR